MSSLVRADINLNGHELFHNVETMSYTKEFLENFQHMPELRVGPLCFKVCIDALNILVLCHKPCKRTL